MPAEKHLKFLFLRLFYHLRSLKTLFWVPVAGLNVVAPLLNYRAFQKAGVEELALLPQEFHHLMAIAAPVLCVWWVIFVMREYVEADGAEVLYVCHARNKLWDVIALFLLFLVDLSVLYMVYIYLFAEMWRSFCMLLCVCVFLFGLSFLLMFLTKSVSITLMVVLLYVIASILFITQKNIFPFFSAAYIPAPKLLKSFYLPLAACGLFLSAGGMILNRRKII